ncbi:MAG: hypothetical protein J6I84_03985 [Bacilli bacterium]|nr:hypothetical protein [Bacilli bacterium]
MIPKEIEIQEQIIQKLQKHDISPFSVVFSFEAGDPGGMLSITFYIQAEMNEILGILGYKNQCDKSGWLILEKNNTIIFTGLALLHLYTVL